MVRDQLVIDRDIAGVVAVERAGDLRMQLGALGGGQGVVEHRAHDVVAEAVAERLPFGVFDQPVVQRRAEGGVALGWGCALEEVREVERCERRAENGGPPQQVAGAIGEGSNAALDHTTHPRRRRGELGGRRPLDEQLSRELEHEERITS